MTITTSPQADLASILPSSLLGYINMIPAVAEPQRVLLATMNTTDLKFGHILQSWLTGEVDVIPQHQRGFAVAARIGNPQGPVIAAYVVSTEQHGGAWHAVVADDLLTTPSRVAGTSSTALGMVVNGILRRMNLASAYSVSIHAVPIQWVSKEQPAPVIAQPVVEEVSPPESDKTVVPDKPAKQPGKYAGRYKPKKKTT
jgi:hypothetical protein